MCVLPTRAKCNLYFIVQNNSDTLIRTQKSWIYRRTILTFKIITFVIYKLFIFVDPNTYEYFKFYWKC